MPVLRVILGGRREDIPFEGAPKLDDVLRARGLLFARPCGGRGACGKCAVLLSGDVSAPNAAETRAGTRLSCQAVLLGDCEAVLPARRAIMQIEGASGEAKQAQPGAALGAAIDIGTTTLALKAFDLLTGEALAAAAAENPQTDVAADVMGRIGAAMNGRAAFLKEEIEGALADLLAAAAGLCGASPDKIQKLVVTGNTAMLYLLTGRDPAPLSRAPFMADCLFGREESVFGKTAYLPPCMHAFVGADITCAALASGMCQSNQTALLCDIGTNGEMALWQGGTLFVASTAAGPAFEGAGITRGVGSVRGAIDKVWLENGEICASTVGGAPAVGVCGSGLIDAVAAYLTLGVIDETGAADADDLPLRDGVSLYPKDIRAVQLAKAAIAAGIETLIKSAGIAESDVQTLYIAGGFGNHMNIASAAAIGLIPPALAGKAVCIGNGALAGAAQLLLRGDAKRAAEAIARAARHVSFGGSPAFNDAYIEHMMFE